MKKFYLLLILALPMRALAQPIIHNCDNYSVGDVLTYVDCDVTGIEPGTGGANHTWDLSWLGAFTIDSLERQYFLPNPSGSPFPLASVVDSESFLGNLLYMKINAGQTSVLGTYDVGFSVNTEYTTPQALSQRPIAYNDSFHTTFTRKSPFPEAITGSGTVDIVADGYGTLILPNGTDSNVLRVVHYISETDTSGGHSYTTPHIDYFWYDDKHVAPLCVMLRDSVPSLFITYEVMYLQKETPGLAVKNVAAQKFPAFNGNL
ncbi:MAG TPA: hypothetical protein VN721_02625, partial [Flavipsychrobacter sp.]|nr:hypothetical protein [Flavipsychrobacter sp.]